MLRNNFGCYKNVEKIVYFCPQYNYDYKCSLQDNEHGTANVDQVTLCTMENVPKEVNFNIMSDEKNSSSRGRFSNSV